MAITPIKGMGELPKKALEGADNLGASIIKGAKKAASSADEFVKKVPHKERITGIGAIALAATLAISCVAGICKKIKEVRQKN